MSTQKACLLPSADGTWELAENAIPTPGPKDVLVKIMSTALNPVDWKMQEFGLNPSQIPFIGGSDAAGIVEATGSEVTTFAKGDRILFQSWFDKAHSTFQQYCIVPADMAAKIPPKITFDQAASVSLALATVASGLRDYFPEATAANFPAPWEEGGLTKFANKPIFIIGGASSVGQYAIQMARLSKHSPIIATATPHNATLLKSLGATHVIDRSLAPEQILVELKTMTGGAPVEHVFDAISLADTQTLGYNALAPGGTLLLSLSENIPNRPPGDGKWVVYVKGVPNAEGKRHVRVELFKRLTGWLETGAIVPNRVEVLPNGLAGIPDGLKRLKEGKVSGYKLVARPQETPS